MVERDSDSEVAWIRKRKESYRDTFELGFRVTELPTAVWSWRFERGRQKTSSLYTMRLRVYIDERKLTTNTQSTNLSVASLKRTNSHPQCRSLASEMYRCFSLFFLSSFLSLSHDYYSFTLHRHLVSFLGIEITFVNIFLLPTYATSRAKKCGSRDAWCHSHNDVVGCVISKRIT